MLNKFNQWFDNLNEVYKLIILVIFAGLSGLMHIHLIFAVSWVLTTLIICYIRFKYLYGD